MENQKESTKITLQTYLSKYEQSSKSDESIENSVQMKKSLKLSALLAEDNQPVRKEPKKKIEKPVMDPVVKIEIPKRVIGESKNVPKIPIMPNNDIAGIPEAEVVKAKTSTAEVISEQSHLSKIIETYNINEKSIFSSAKKKRAKADKSIITEGFTQNFIPVEKISHGIIHTTDGRYVKILEVLPINVKNKSMSTINEITDSFATVFTGNIKTLQLMTLTDTSNASVYVSRMDKLRLRTNNELLKERISDYIQHIKDLSQSETISRRFFIVFQYEGESNGKKSKNLDEIYSTMRQNQFHIMNAMRTAGNTIVYSDNENYHIGEILYYYFNRQTVKEESLESRIARLNRDEDIFNTYTNSRKSTNDIDYIATKGIQFTGKDYEIMDGMYRTYLTIDTNYYPKMNMTAGWTDIFTYDDHVDISVYSRMQNKEIIMPVLNKYTQLKTITTTSSKNSEKQKDNYKQINNNRYVFEMLKNNNEEFLNVVIILTIKAKSLKLLREYKRQIMTYISSNYGIRVTESYLDCKEYSQMTMPLLCISNKIFNANYHNFLSSGMSSFYNYTSYEFKDPSGIVIGHKREKGQINSLFSYNPFNRSYVSNSNMFIGGSSGNGKTVTLQTLGQRLHMEGIRVHYIIPKKGHEYLKSCNSIGGNFIRVGPSTDVCINLLAIMPQAKINTNVLSDDIKLSKASYLANKIAFMTTHTQLLLGTREKDELTTREINHFTSALYEMYRSFGITEDNNSIYTDAGQKELKTMPIVGDMMKTIENNPELARIYDAYTPWIDGICKNMNGQTNVDLTSTYTVYYIDEDNTPTKYFSAYLYLVFTIVYDIAKSTQNIQDMVFLDEIWKMMRTKESADQVIDMIKIIRGYMAGVVLSTQDIKDILKSSSEMADTIMNNTAAKILLGFSKNEIDFAEKVVPLTEKDKTDLLSCSPGEGIMFIRDDVIPIKISLSKQDDMLFRTDLDTTTNETLM